MATNNVNYSLCREIRLAICSFDCISTSDLALPSRAIRIISVQVLLRLMSLKESAHGICNI